MSKRVDRAGSHLPKGLILYALTGESYPCSAAVAEQAKQAIGCRRAAAAGGGWGLSPLLLTAPGGEG